MEIYAIVLVVMLVLIWAAFRAYKSNGKLEANNEGLQETLEIIEANRKVKYENIDMVNHLSEPERSRLREKWTRK